MQIPGGYFRCDWATAETVKTYLQGTEPAGSCSLPFPPSPLRSFPYGSSRDAKGMFSDTLSLHYILPVNRNVSSKGKIAATKGRATAHHPNLTVCPHHHRRRRGTVYFSPHSVQISHVSRNGIPPHAELNQVTRGLCCASSC